jgi:hypothetical protein
MDSIILLSKLIVSVSVAFVWVFRFENIIQEFNEFGIPNLLRNLVGAVKIALSTLLVVSIWYPSLAFYPSLCMAFLMLCAQLAHFKVKNPWTKHVPSLILLLLCLFIAGVDAKLIQF